VASSSPPDCLPPALGSRALVFHTPEWAAAVSDCYGFEDLSLACGSGGLPLFHTRSPLLGDKLVSAVFNTYASPLWSGEDECEELVARAVELAEARRVAFLELKSLRELPDAVVRRFDLRCRRHFLLSLLPLGGDDPEAGFGRNFRKNLRRARRGLAERGVRIEISRDRGDLRCFHDLLVRSQRDRHAMLVQPFGLLEALHHRFLVRDRGHLWVARSARGEVVGGLLVLEHAGTASACFVTVRKDHRDGSLDAAMKAEAVRFYHQRGATLLDFGLSSPKQQGLLFAKSRFGVCTTALPYYYRLVRARRVPDLDFHDAYPRLRRPYRWAPLPVARRLSDWLPRYLN
jgi:hypothetical protein